MVATSTTEREAFIPPWADAENPRTYFLRAGSLIERGQLEAELADLGAGEVWPFQKEAAFSAGLIAIAGDEDAQAILGLVEQDRAGEPLSAEDQATLTEARSVVREHWPEYREICAQEQRRDELTPVLAFRRFCVGWDGIDVEFTKRLGVVTDDAMRRINPLDLRAAGLRAFNMLYAAGEAKNSEAPSLSNGGEPTSNSADMSKADGASEQTSG